MVTASPAAESCGGRSSISLRAASMRRVNRAEHLAGDFPTTPRPCISLGIVAHSCGDRVEALELLRRAAESPATTALYLLSYAELCCKPVDCRPR